MVFRGAKIDVFQRFVPLGNFGTVLWGQGLESPLARPGCVLRLRVFGEAEQDITGLIVRGWT